MSNGTGDRTHTERSLVDSFMNELGSGGSPWGTVSFSSEFDYQRGRTDLVAMNKHGELVAFEAKMNNWRHALHQAHRNLCFAHRSYVLLPTRVAAHASKYSAHFARVGIGLCTIVDGDVEIIFEAEQGEPVQPWLTKVAAAFIQSACGEE